MKRNLFRSVALITMLSFGASSVFANQDEESVLTRQGVEQLVKSLKNGAELTAESLVAFYAEHKDQILNRALPAVLTVVAGVFLIKTWPAAVPATTTANAESGQEEPVNVTPKSTRKSNRTPQSKRNAKKKTE